MAQKAADEKSLQQFVSSDPQRKQEFGDPWAADREGGRGARANLQAAVVSRQSWRLPRRPGTLCARHRARCRGKAEAQQPAHPGLSGFATADPGDSAFSPAPRYTNRWNRWSWRKALARCSEVLGADNPDVKKALAGKTSEERAKEVIEGTKLEDVAVRKQLYEGGQAAVDASTDPLIVHDASSRSRCASGAQLRMKIRCSRSCAAAAAVLAKRCLPIKG